MRHPKSIASFSEAPLASECIVEAIKESPAPSESTTLTGGFAVTTKNASVSLSIPIAPSDPHAQINLAL